MNANKTLMTVTTIAALTAAAFALPAAANDYREFRRDARVMRHADFPASHRYVIVERRVAHYYPPVVISRPVVVHQPVVVERPVYVERPVPVYYPAPQPVHAYAPPPVHYSQPAPYRDDRPNAAGAIAGAVIGGVIGNQVGHHGSRGVTTAAGALFGGLIGSRF